MILSLLVAVGLRRWSMRVAVCVVLLVVVVTAWHRVQAPWWDNAGDLREMQDNMASGAGYEGTDEYTPAGADASVTSKEARRVIVDGPAHAAIHVFEWNAESKMFTAEMSAPAKLALRLFNYPAWRVVVNGRAIRAETLNALGMAEKTYGWNLEMQMRVAAAGLRIREIPVDHRCRRGGVSKVSGNVTAGLSAAWKITTTFLRLAATLRRTRAATAKV